MKILVTGTAGFIGFHLVKRLLERGDEVIGIDNINDYYDVRLKYGRLRECGIEQCEIEYGKSIQSKLYDHYRFIKLDLDDVEGIRTLFEQEKPAKVCHLAAQAGVRYSLINPGAYIKSNISGFFNILESCRHNPVEHLVYASSSSVYGMNKKMPFSTSDNVDHPVSLYAASKKSNELMAHSYSNLFSLPTTGLRFFTVYGPWGRPDMALFLFTKAIINNKPIEVYNHGNMLRDFTYINDIIEGVTRVIDNPPAPDPAWDAEKAAPDTSVAPYKVYNIGNCKPVKLLDFVSEIENALNKKARKQFLPLQPGDVEKTWANVDDLVQNLNYQPDTPISKGVKEFIAWYKQFYNAD